MSGRHRGGQESTVQASRLLAPWPGPSPWAGAGGAVGGWCPEQTQRGPTRLRAACHLSGGQFLGTDPYCGHLARFRGRAFVSRCWWSCGCLSQSAWRAKHREEGHSPLWTRGHGPRPGLLWPQDKDRQLLARRWPLSGPSLACCPSARSCDVPTASSPHLGLGSLSPRV